MTRRILVPYDESEQADYALSHALDSFGSAKIVLLHVVEPFADHTGAGGYEAKRYKQKLETAEKMLENVRDEHKSERVETVVQYGRPAHAIVQYINRDSIDHVVIGSHGRDGATRLLLGSVAETVARRSQVPVTVVRTPRSESQTPEHVLVPFDASVPARRALENALEKYESADITVLYVAYPPDAPLGPTDTVFEVLENWEEERADHIHSILTTAEAIADEYGRTIRTKNAHGEPAATICTFCEENDVDHVVIGSTGRDGVARLLLGSVAEKVIRRAPVSVTVIK